MSIQQVRTILKYIRKFSAGLVSVVPFTKTKLGGYPFARPLYALDKDWLDMGSDIETATQKSKK